MAEVVLVAEDDPQIFELISVILETKGFEIQWAKDGEEAFRKALRVRPGLVLLDIMMPKLNGYEVLHLLKEDLGTKDIPVIFLSAKCQTDDKVVGLRMGGQDFISKPFDIYELLARVEAALRIKNFPGPLRRGERRLSETSISDPLTGVYTRDFFLERLQEEIARGRKHHYPLGCVLLTVAHFEEVRAKFGSLTSDQVLQRLALLLKNANRMVDIIGRLHANTFIMALTQTDAGGALAFGNRMKELVKRSRLVAIEPKYQLRIRIASMAFGPGDTLSPEQLLGQLESLLSGE